MPNVFTSFFFTPFVAARRLARRRASKQQKRSGRVSRRGLEKNNNWRLAERASFRERQRERQCEHNLDTELPLYARRKAESSTPEGRRKVREGFGGLESMEGVGDKRE